MPLVFSLSFVEQFFQFNHELIDILKLAIDGGESHISHVVPLLELFNNSFAYISAPDLPLTAFLK